LSYYHGEKKSKLEADVKSLRNAILCLLHFVSLLFATELNNALSMWEIGFNTSDTAAVLPAFSR